MAVSPCHETATNSKESSSKCKFSSKTAKYSIPKVQKDIKDYLHSVPKGSRDETEILSAFKNSFLNQSFNMKWIIKSIKLINNTYLEERFHEKRRCFKNLYNFKEVEELYCFQTVSKDSLNKISTYGARVNTCVRTTDSLGNPTKGVHLFKHADVCIQLSSSKYLKLLIYKVVTGKVKVIDTQDQGVDFEPTPGYDCHVSRTKADPSCNLIYNIDRSKIYLYEYNDMCDTVEYPRHCLPYAVISFDFKIWVKNSGSTTKRNRDRICNDEPVEKIMHRSTDDFWTGKPFEDLQGQFNSSNMMHHTLLPNDINLDNINTNITLEDLSKSISQVNALLKMVNSSHLKESLTSPRTPSPAMSNNASFSPEMPDDASASENALDTIKVKQYSPFLVTIKNTNSVNSDQYSYDSSSNLELHNSVGSSFSNQQFYDSTSESNWIKYMSFNDNFHSNMIHDEQKSDKNFNWYERNNDSFSHNQYGDVDYREQDICTSPSYKSVKSHNPNSFFDDRVLNVNENCSTNFQLTKALHILNEISNSKSTIVDCINALVINVLHKKLDDLTDLDDKSAVLRTIEILETSVTSESNCQSESILLDNENKESSEKDAQINQNDNSSKVASIYSPDGILSGGPSFPNAQMKPQSSEGEINRRDSTLLDDLSNQSDGYLHDDIHTIETYNDVSSVKTDSDKCFETLKKKKCRKLKDSFHGRTLLKGEGVDPRTIPIKIPNQSVDDPRIKRENSLVNSGITLIIPDFKFENGCEVVEGGKQPNFDVSLICNQNPEDDYLSKKSIEDMKLVTDEILSCNLVNTSKDNDVRRVISKVIKKTEKKIKLLNYYNGKLNKATKRIGLQSSEGIKKKLKLECNKLQLLNNSITVKINSSLNGTKVENAEKSLVNSEDKSKADNQTVNSKSKIIEQNFVSKLKSISIDDIKAFTESFVKQMKAASTVNKNEKSSTSSEIKTELEPNNLLKYMSGYIEQETIAKIKKIFDYQQSASLAKKFSCQKTSNQKSILTPTSVTFNGVDISGHEVEGLKDKLCYDDMELGSDSERENDQLIFYNSTLSRSSPSCSNYYQHRDYKNSFEQNYLLSNNVQHEKFYENCKEDYGPEMSFPSSDIEMNDSYIGRDSMSEQIREILNHDKFSFAYSDPISPRKQFASGKSHRQDKNQRCEVIKQSHKSFSKKRTDGHSYLGENLERVKNRERYHSDRFSKGFCSRLNQIRYRQKNDSQVSFYQRLYSQMLFKKQNYLFLANKYIKKYIGLC